MSIYTYSGPKLSPAMDPRQASVYAEKVRGIMYKHSLYEAWASHVEIMRCIFISGCYRSEALTSVRVTTEFVI